MKIDERVAEIVSRLRPKARAALVELKGNDPSASVELYCAGLSNHSQTSTGGFILRPTPLGEQARDLITREKTD